MFWRNFSVVLLSFHLWNLLGMCGDATRSIATKIWADFVHQQNTFLLGNYFFYFFYLAILFGLDFGSVSLGVYNFK